MPEINSNVQGLQQPTTFSNAAKNAAGTAAFVVDPEKMYVIGQIAAAVRRYLKVTVSELAVVEGLRFGALGAAPIVLKNIYTSSKDLYQGAPEKADNALSLISYTGNLADIAALIADGLDTMRWASASAAWVDPLYIVGAVLSTAGIILDSKNIYETHTIAKLLNEQMTVTKAGGDNVAVAFARGVEVIKQKHKTNSRFVSKYFAADGNKFTERLDEISRYAVRKLASPLPHKVKEGEDEVKNTKKLIDKKLSAKKWSHAFSILTSVISLVGFGILFSPIAPAGLVLIGLAGTLSLIHRFYMKRVDRKFQEALQIKG